MKISLIFQLAKSSKNGRQLNLAHLHLLFSSSSNHPRLTVNSFSPGYVCLALIYLLIYFFPLACACLSVCEWVFGEEHTGGYLILSAACFSLNSYCGPWGPGDTHLQEPHFTEHCLLENSLNTLSHNVNTNNSAHSKPSESMDTQIVKKIFHTQASNTDPLLLHTRTSLQTFACIHECNTMISHHGMWIRKWFYHFTTIKSFVFVMTCTFSLHLKGYFFVAMKYYLLYYL